MTYVNLKFGCVKIINHLPITPVIAFTHKQCGFVNKFNHLNTDWPIFSTTKNSETKNESKNSKTLYHLINFQLTPLKVEFAKGGVVIVSTGNSLLLLCHAYFVYACQKTLLVVIVYERWYKYLFKRGIIFNNEVVSLCLLLSSQLFKTVQAKSILPLIFITMYW